MGSKRCTRHPSFEATRARERLSYRLATNTHADAGEGAVEESIFRVRGIYAAIHGAEEEITAIAEAKLGIVELIGQTCEAADIGHRHHSRTRRNTGVMAIKRGARMLTAMSKNVIRTIVVLSCDLVMHDCLLPS